MSNVLDLSKRIVLGLDKRNALALHKRISLVSKGGMSWLSTRSLLGHNKRSV